MKDNYTQSGKNAIELIRALNNSVLALGLKKVIFYLKTITKISGDVDKTDLVDLIIHTVCEKYKINARDLNNPRLDGKYFDAICIICALLKSHAIMSQDDISARVKKHKSQIHVYLRKIARLNPEMFRADAKLYTNYIEITKSIDLIINQEQQQLWIKNNEEDLENLA